MKMKKRVIAVLAALALAVPMGMASMPQAQAACYSAGTSQTPFVAEAHVNYGSCKVGTTRSVAHVNTTGDSGWYQGSTSARASGFNLIDSHAEYYVSGIR